MSFTRRVPARVGCRSFTYRRSRVVLGLPAQAQWVVHGGLHFPAASLPAVLPGTVLRCARSVASRLDRFSWLFNSWTWFFRDDAWICSWSTRFCRGATTGVWALHRPIRKKLTTASTLRQIAASGALSVCHEVRSSTLVSCSYGYSSRQPGPPRPGVPHGRGPSQWPLCPEQVRLRSPTG
jgi:hypothetical protein